MQEQILAMILLEATYKNQFLLFNHIVIVVVTLLIMQSSLILTNWIQLTIPRDHLMWGWKLKKNQTNKQTNKLYPPLRLKNKQTNPTHLSE